MTKKIKTIGIGHRIKPDEKDKYKNLIISYDIIKNLLIEDLKSPIQSVKNIGKLADKIFTQNEKDALLSYILNKGSGNWINSEVYKSIKRKDFSNIKNNFLKDIENQDAETKKGLTNRRNREYNLFEISLVQSVSDDLKSFIEVYGVMYESYTCPMEKIEYSEELPQFVHDHHKAE